MRKFVKFDGNSFKKTNLEIQIRDRFQYMSTPVVFSTGTLILLGERDMHLISPEKRMT